MQEHQTRRDFMRTGSLGALGGLLAGCGSGTEDPATSQRPNIVLIMADDMGFSDIGCYGGEMETPTLDRLAANGLRFTQFYNTARCCPTRAALMTGLYQHQADMGWMTYDAGIPGYRGDLAPNCVTIAEALKPAGYNTYMHGKWHLTTHYGHWIEDEIHTSKHNWPLQRGFDRFYGIIDGTSNFFQPYSLVEDNEPEPLDMDPDYYFTDAVSDHCVQCIDDTPADTPFFSYVAYTAPHFPLHAFPEDIAEYDGRFDEGWESLREQRYRRMVDMGIIDPSWALSPLDEDNQPYENEEHREYRLRCMEVYAAMIERMDRGIGSIVDALERSGRLDNTVIFFLSDNGAQSGELGKGTGTKRYTPLTARDGRPMHAGNDPEIMPGPEDTYQAYGIGWANLSNTPYRRFKGWMYEGGTSSPLIVHWPAGIPAGETRNQVGHVMDIMPTCCSLAGTTYPTRRDGQAVTPVEGECLMPSFAGDPVERGPLFWEHQGHRAVRSGTWKIVSYGNRDWELYDMVADRTELHDSAAEHPEVVSELASLYDAWAERCGVRPWPEVNEARAAAQKHMDEVTRQFRSKTGI
jgi:arylsulfatase A-like enzyme